MPRKTSTRYRLGGQPALAYAGHPNCNAAPERVTVEQCKRKLPAVATDFAMFRTSTGRASNAFFHYRLPGLWVAQYHDTRILTLAVGGADNGTVTARFSGWHTPTTRERFNIAAEHFGLDVRAHACGRDRTAFHTNRSGRVGRIDDQGKIPSDYETLRLVPGIVERTA